MADCTITILGPIMQINYPPDDATCACKRQVAPHVDSMLITKTLNV